MRLPNMFDTHHKNLLKIDCITRSRRYF